MSLTYHEKETLFETTSDINVSESTLKSLDNIDSNKKLTSSDKRRLISLAKKVDLSTLNKHRVNRANLIKHIRKS